MASGKVLPWPTKAIQLRHRYSDVVAHLVFGENMWTYSERTRDYYNYNFVFYNDRILGASKEGRIVSLNVVNSSSSKEIKNSSSSTSRISIEEISSEILQLLLKESSLYPFFVETTNGELLMVGRILSRSPQKTKIQRYNIFKIINSNGRIDVSSVVDLGGHSLFLGKHSSISVMASNYPGFCRPNTIYYVGSLNLQNCGVFEEFNLEDQSFHVDEDRFAMCEGSWIVPSMKLTI
ncbi:hypothetical protein FNV43_RR16277 [Rhamnella rubrinervis]|uniref:KIB1-4 beta-propeller domain-containing protein n=1 Tax=Rhamnella rubrinervis TaxID=2594499 RepID=A0A8K0GYH2_9ROSA|nr:hypothetical protein FNV43_RR16277 [Rhamnella rubrinervis]